MGLIRNRLLRRFSPLGRVADVFLIAGFALKFAHRKGWVSDDLMRSVGLESAVDTRAASGGQQGLGLGDLVLGAGAIWRTVRRRRRS